MKPREKLLTYRLLLNKSYSDYLMAKTVLMGLDHNLLKPLSRHPNDIIAADSVRLRIECMELLEDLSCSYKKMYDNLIESTYKTCVGPKPPKNSLLNLLDPDILFPLWNEAYSEAIGTEKFANEYADKLRNGMFYPKEDIDINNIKFYFVQYLDVIDYWHTTFINPHYLLVFELKNHLIKILERFDADIKYSSRVPKTSKYLTEPCEGDNFYEV